MKRYKQILFYCLCWSTRATTAPPSVAPKQHPSHGQHFHLHLAALGETEVQQRTDHQLHGALQPGGHHQRLLGVLSHQVSVTKNFIMSIVFNFCPEMPFQNLLPRFMADIWTILRDFLFIIYITEPDTNLNADNLKQQDVNLWNITYT